MLLYSTFDKEPNFSLLFWFNRRLIEINCPITGPFFTGFLVLLPAQVGICDACHIPGGSLIDWRTEGCQMHPGLPGFEGEWVTVRINKPDGTHQSSGFLIFFAAGCPEQVIFLSITE